MRTGSPPLYAQTNNQTLPSPSDKRPSTGLTVDRVAHHVLSSGKSTYHRPAGPCPLISYKTNADTLSRITRAFLIEEATIVKRVLKAKTTGKK